MKGAAPSIRRQVQLCLGKAGTPIGSLLYVRQGRRENSAIAYDETWLANPERFNVSADLQLAPGHQSHKAATSNDSVFHGAIADTAPDAWGRRVIARNHAKRRKHDPRLSALTEMDYLMAVDDFSRVGALRLRAPEGRYHREVDEGRRSTPPLIELGRIFQASQALERGEETARICATCKARAPRSAGCAPSARSSTRTGGSPSASSRA